MANLFYGVCSSADSAETKIINRSNAEKTTAIEEGDLLVVYFANGNTVKSPKLHIDNLTDNQGLVVKTQNVEEGSDDMWQPGEVVSFVLVSQQLNTDNDTSTEEGATTYNAEDASYWVLDEGGRATTEWYGMTKLFYDTLDRKDEWKNNTTTAVTPKMLADLYDKLPVEQEEIYIPRVSYRLDNTEGEDEPDGIQGYLTIDDTEYTIFDRSELIQKTSQLYNDASGSPGSNDADGTYYITNQLPANFNIKTFNDTLPQYQINGIPVLWYNNTGNQLFTGGNSAPATYIGRGNVYLGGSNVYKSGNDFHASGDLYEHNTALKNRYSPILYTKSWNTGTLTIGSKDTCQQTVTAEMAEIGGGGIYTSGSKTAHCHINVTVSGYKAIGLIGWNVNKVTNYSAADAKWANIWECRLESSNTKDFVNYAVMNLNNATIHVNVTFTVLYQKVL